MSPSLFSLYDGKMPAYIFSFFSFGRWTFERLVVMEFDTLSDVYDTYKNGVIAKYFGDLLSDSGTCITILMSLSPSPPSPMPALQTMPVRSDTIVACVFLSLQARPS